MRSSSILLETQKLAPSPGGGFIPSSRQGSVTAFATSSLPDAFGDAELGYLRDIRCNLRDQYLSILLCPSKRALVHSTSHNNYVMFFTVIYLLSNKLVPWHIIFDFQDNDHSHLFQALDLVFAAVPIEYLEDLIRERLASIRAAFEALLIITGRFKQQSAFQLLLRIGFRYDWIAISVWSSQLLYYAVSMDLDDALQMLLEKHCRPDVGKIFYDWSKSCHSTAINEALRRGNLRAMHLLLDCGDVGALLSTDRDPYPEKLSNFDCFLFGFHNDEENLQCGLNAFIRAGADVNKPVVPPLTFTVPFVCLGLGIWNVDFQRRTGQVPACEGDTRLSVLDYLFYFHRPVFGAISSKSSRTQPGLPSRASILLSLEEGTQNLQQYLDSLAQRIGQQRLFEFLRLMIAEQFLGCDLNNRKTYTDLKTVHALVSCGVSIAEVSHRFPNILDDFIKSIRRFSSDFKKDMDAVQYLLENGVHIGGSALSWLAQLPERHLFDLALNHVGSPTELHVALAEVASCNDFQTVQRLLDAGADLGVDTIGSAPEIDCPRFMMGIIARFIQSSIQKSVELPEMLEFLIKKGAPLRLSERMPQLHHLLQFILVQVRFRGEVPRIQETVEYVMRADHKDTLFWPSSLLEFCRSTVIFEQLFRRGVQLQPGSPLVQCINIGGGIGLIREMLTAGASPNAYSRHSRFHLHQTPLQAAAYNLRVDIVELLLQEGADVNAPPKGGFWPGTALQAVCRRPLEEFSGTSAHGEKLKTIQLLLAWGADVNAAPMRTNGQTALQATAAQGDLAAAKLLLLHNPMADVNAPPCQGHFTVDGRIPLELGTPLDLAAENGRLDMVKLLLSCNALSHRRGEDGYDGAIFLAEQKGHLAVADLIREHAKDDQRWQLSNPYLSERPRHWSEYGYKRDLDEDSECSYDSLSTDIHDVYLGTDPGIPHHTDESSTNSTGTDSVVSYDTDEEEPSGAAQETQLVVHPEANQEVLSEAVYDYDVGNSTQPLTHDALSTAATLENNTRTDQWGLALEYGETDVSALYPLYASHPWDQMDLDTSMDLDMSLGGGVGQAIGAQHAGRFDYELGAPNRLVYEVDGEWE